MGETLVDVQLNIYPCCFECLSVFDAFVAERIVTSDLDHLKKVSAT